MAKAEPKKKPAKASGTATKGRKVTAESRLEAFLGGGDAKAKTEKPKDSAYAESDLDASEDDDAPAAVWGADVATEDNKTIEQTYQKKSQLEHILLRPDTYIGSVEPINQQLWVYDSDLQALQYRDVKITPGLYKIFDEILVNAADNKIRDQTMDTIKVVIDRENNMVSVCNNGKGIPVQIHKEENMYVPELIFGHLLTSSNYDDNQKKVTGGRNGYGAKLCNIFSTEFTVETADRVSGKKFKQVFRRNMSQRDKPSITKNSRNEEYTKITFRPDLAKFHMEELDEDITSLFKKRVYDLAGTLAGVKVFLNGDRIKLKNFKQYVEMYLNAPEASKKGKKAKTDPEAAADPVDAMVEDASPVKSAPVIIYETVNSRWEVAFAVSEGQFQQVSFVNSICTTKGGTHVSHVADQIATRLVEVVKKKSKTNVKPFQVKNHMWLFINCLIENPSFDSQTKETMTLRQSAFGSKCAPSEGFYKKILSSEIITNVLSWARFKLDQQLKKTDGTRTQRLMGIDDLDDATCAGGREAHKCTLVLTEGKSARALALAGFEIVGKKYFGVYPLRGKMLNVRGAKPKQLLENKELNNIKRILGLKHGATESTARLRYGRLMIMTDQDYDGSHIKGLIINFVDYFFPGLIKEPGFLLEFVTPIVRAVRGKRSLNFFTIPEFEAWAEQIGPELRHWDCKYYKGLGTSDAKDARRYFSALDIHRKNFAGCTSEDRKLLDMVFNSKRADERKEWLRQFKPGTFLDHSQDNIAVRDFINRELILFSMADNVRSIPSVVDGFKPGQRKILYVCIKRKVKKEVRVSQLAAQVAADSAYHHGEESLSKSIIAMAQDFVGSNNVNLLSPNGQFGTRLSGGDDSASPRYLHTLLAPITRKIFNPHDDHLLTYLKDDSTPIEPEWYIPVLPVILINNANGIGTGWSTNIPSYNPTDIVGNIRRLMKDEEMVPMVPWYRGYKGRIEPEGPDRFRVTGKIEKIDDNTVEITELPIRLWTESYKQMIESWCLGTDKTPAFVKDYVNHSGVYSVQITVKLSDQEMRKAEAEGLEKRFRLTSTLSTSNMICFDKNGRIKKYESPQEIIRDFYDVRLSYYQKRKDWLINQLSQDWARLDNRVKFILEIIEKKLVVQNRKKADIVADLRKRGYKPMAKSNSGKSESLATNPVGEGDDNEAGEAANAAPGSQATGDSAADFDYLLSMPIWNLTREKVEQMLKERDAKQAEVDVLLKTSPAQLWNADLDDFLVAWEEKLADHEQMERETLAARDAHEKRTNKGKGRAKPKTKRKLTSVDEDNDGMLVEDSDDEDFAPAKKTTRKPSVKTKANSGDAAAKPATQLAATGTLDGFLAKPPEATAQASSGAAGPAKVKVKAKTNPKVSQASKPAVVPSDDSESEDDLSLSLTARMNKLLAARKRKSMGGDSDSDTPDALARPSAPSTTGNSTTQQSPPKRAKATKITAAKASRAAPAIVNDNDSPVLADSDASNDSDAAPPKSTTAARGRGQARGRGRGRGRGAAATNGRQASTKLAIESDAAMSSENDDGDSDVPVVSTKRATRTARGTGRKATSYVEISDSDGSASNAGDSLAEDDGDDYMG